MTFETAFVETDVPGAICSVDELDGITVYRNGCGSIVARDLPVFEAEETPVEKVDRLAAELKEAKAELKRSQR